MEFNTQVYLCHECKDVIDNIEKLLFVEEDSTRGFCSETCIEKFYSPLFTFYEQQEKEIRKELSLENEDCLSMLDDATLIDKLLNHPDEIWCSRNDMEEEIYTFIGQYQDENNHPYYLMSLCLLYEKRPSFIFVASCTRSKELADKFKIGEPVNSVDAFTKVETHEQGGEIDDLISGVEAKKSSFLAELLEKRSPADIPFEKFPIYDMFFEQTVEEPDEIFSYNDEEGDTIYVYIKAHDKDGASFYYFVVSFNYQSNFEQRLESLLPIISFPSVDPELYRFYCKGERLTGSLKN
ncbi:MAG: hypothetical protein HN576_03595 [Bacteriovoracaceae bacterium]|jgi:hypothetical protein|nr:hypothetical protein [Bacteriovoracaceae bacterium]